MISCPNCKKDKMAVIDSRLSGHGEYTRRRLECGGCRSRFTSHEIRESDLADTNAVNFFLTLSKIQGKGGGYKNIRKSKKNGALVRLRWYQRALPCCFGTRKGVVNY
jgi:hypothetical protein